MMISCTLNYIYQNMYQFCKHHFYSIGYHLFTSVELRKSQYQKNLKKKQLVKENLQSKDVRHAQSLWSHEQIVGWRASEQPQAMVGPGCWAVDDISSATHPPGPVCYWSWGGARILGHQEGRATPWEHQPDPFLGFCSCAHNVNLNFSAFLK